MSEDWRQIRWPISIGQPPNVIQAGVGRHGTHGPERYHLPDLWCLHFYGYEASLWLGKTRFPIRPGYVGVIPPDTPVEYRYNGPSVHLFVHFRCWTSEQSAQAAQVAAMQDLGADFPAFSNRLEQAIREAGNPAHRLQARVWDILCDLAERTKSASINSGAEHPTVQHVKAQIELRLSEELSVERLARETGVSVGYLSKLFRQSDDTTVVGYIRSRRMRRAGHLLRYSTLPIKAIAASVGIPDLHLFNKTVRRELGQSPRALRAGKARQ